MAATAQPLFPFDVWVSQQTQAATIANDNALRAEVIGLPALSFEATQPGSPTNGDLYVLSAAWGDEVTGTLAFYRDGWSYWTPFDGMRKFIGGVECVYAAGSTSDWTELVSVLGDYADDAAAASGGVPVGGEYRTGSIRKLRIA